MSTYMRGLFCEGVMICVPLDYWICFVETFQMSTSIRGPLCEWMMIWVLGFVSLRAFE